MNYDRNKVAQLLRDNHDLKGYVRHLIQEVSSKQVAIHASGETEFYNAHLDSFKNAYKVWTGQGDRVISIQRISDRRIIKEGAAIIYNGYPAKIESMMRDNGELSIKVYIYRTKDYFSGVKLSEIEPVL